LLFPEANKDLAAFKFPEKLQKNSLSKPIDFLFVIDFECTCENTNNEDYFYEIIEFPIIVIDAKRNIIVDIFHSFVKPVINPILSAFCMSLTGIN